MRAYTMISFQCLRERGKEKVAQQVNDQQSLLWAREQGEQWARCVLTHGESAGIPGETCSGGTGSRNRRARERGGGVT